MSPNTEKKIPMTSIAIVRAHMPSAFGIGQIGVLDIAPRKVR